jgi:hypothetical protein
MKNEIRKMSGYLFPTRNPSYPDVNDIIYKDGFPPTHPVYKKMYDRAHRSDEGKRWRLQYVCIEEELERACRYVDPCDENAAVFSMKFAETIRAAANAYEILAKELYDKFYGEPTRQINVYDYLALDVHIDLHYQSVMHFVAQGEFKSHSEVCRPFSRLSSWDKASTLDSSHVPRWWTAYNKVKHTNKELKDHATLANALAATAALFLMI